MATINAKFMSLAKAAVFNPSKWTPVPGMKFSLEDILNSETPGLFSHVVEANVTQTMFADGSIAKRISVVIDDGTVLDYRMSGESTLEVGDKVDPKTVYGQQLRKLGREDIVRYDGEKLK
jgi:hypothetical protein